MLTRRAVNNPSLQSSSYDVKLMERRISQLLEKYSSGLWMSKVPGLYCEMFGQELQPQVLTDMRKWTHVCMVSLSFIGDVLTDDRRSEV